MKKILKIGLIISLLLPIILKAQDEEKEWRWYKEIEENITYKKDVENNCEYFDKENYINGDWIYQTTRPEEKEGREIIELPLDINIKREYVNIIKIKKFDTTNTLENTYIYELTLMDASGNEIDYNVYNHYIVSEDINAIKDNNLDTFSELVFNSYIYLDFEKPINIDNLTIKIVYKETENFKGIDFDTYITEELMTNMFPTYSLNKEVKCENNLCTMTIKLNEFYKDPLIVRTISYKYRDKYYKCFQKNKLFVPGYYKNLSGFIKDENNYRIIDVDKITINPILKKEEDFISLNKDSPGEIINKEVSEEDKEEDFKDETKTNDKNQIAIISKDREENSDVIPKYLLPIILGSLIFLTIYITNKVKKSRTN